MVKIKSVVVSIPKVDLKATGETLKNKYVMDQLKRSKQDIKKGKVRNVREFLKELQ